MEISFLNRGVDVVTKAIKADEEERYKEAVRLYKNAAELFVMAAKFEQNPENVKLIHSRLDEYVTRAEELQASLDGLDNGGVDGYNDQKNIHSMMNHSKKNYKFAIRIGRINPSRSFSPIRRPPSFALPCMDRTV